MSIFTQLLYKNCIYKCIKALKLDYCSKTAFIIRKKHIRPETLSEKLVNSVIPLFLRVPFKHKKVHRKPVDERTSANDFKYAKTRCIKHTENNKGIRRNTNHSKELIYHAELVEQKCAQYIKIILHKLKRWSFIDFADYQFHQAFLFIDSTCYQFCRIFVYVDFDDLTKILI
ncbi:hypothetical protein AGLY_002349 [Aphis glycines]|uniref:Uncharacterized protein n=1 Tax=Aphis glycines TaxID=307491 RepID=A0A6G0U4J9_APHGL|nr:hypothetical protein AGLY_002349 [Aphis glycines]